jgi:hypothetical protein
MSATSILELEFLPLRAKLLDIAASFDRLDRAEGQQNDDPRMTRIREAMSILLQPDGSRAEQIQMVFSREYDENWSSKLGLTL